MKAPTMIIARIAYDAPGKDEQRKALFEGHRAHLRSGMARIVQSGPLFDTDAKGAKRGALVVFEAEDLAEVELPREIAAGSEVVI